MKLTIILTLIANTAIAQLVNYKEITLRVEQFIKADTCTMIFDTSEFKGKNLNDYILYLEGANSDSPYFMLQPGDLLTYYPVPFKGRKGCLDDLLNEAVYGTDLTWEVEGLNILIYRKY